MWDLATGAQLQTLEGHSGAVTSVVFSPDGARLASGSHDESVPALPQPPLQNRKTQNTGVRGTAGGPESTVAAAEGGRCLGLSILRVLSVM